MAAITITVNTLLSLSISTSNTLICVGEEAILTANTTAVNYLWPDGATTMTMAVSPTITADYTVTVDDGQCSSTSTITQQVSLCTEIANLASQGILSVYPNPFNGSFAVNCENNLPGKEIIIDVDNTLRELIYSETTTENKVTIDSKNWKNGAYYVKVNNRATKLIKQD